MLSIILCVLIGMIKFALDVQKEPSKIQQGDVCKLNLNATHGINWQETAFPATKGIHYQIIIVLDPTKQDQKI